jgi:RimK family alpha-L-glutamate ligase
MKIAIIGMNPYFESDRVLYEALLRGHEAVFLSKKNIVETTYFNNGEFGIFFKPPTIEEQVNFQEVFKTRQPMLIKPDASYAPSVSKKGFLGTKVEKVPNLYDINYFDAFLIREISKTLEWATILVNHVLSCNKTVVDQKIGMEMYYKSKHGTFYKASKDHFPYPKTFAITSRSMLLDMLDQVTYPLIVKKSESSKGLGVYKCGSKGEVIDLLSSEELKVGELLFQECIDYSGDIRVFVVGKKVLGAMRREPQAGQWKGNVAQGANAYPIEISEDIKKMALDIVALQNSELIGVDIMLPKTGPVIIETNRAPQFKGFESATGVNVAAEIINYIESKHAKVSNS